MSQSDWPEEGRRPDNADQAGRQPPGAWDEPAAPPPSGMSGGMKACLILVGVGGVCALLCCGVGGYFFYTARPKISNDAADIDAARDEIAKLNLPAGFKPKQMMKTDNLIMPMIMVQYENPGHAELNMMQMRLKFGGKDAQKGMRQSAQQPNMPNMQALNNAKSETKNIKIRGREYPFNFTQGEDRATKKPRHRIQGQFDVENDGMATIAIDFDDTYKDADFVKMLESIP
jgi:hypothetical protein